MFSGLRCYVRFSAPITLTIGVVLKRKQSIIYATTRLFANQGFDGTTTLQIAKEADDHEKKLGITIINPGSI